MLENISSLIRINIFKPLYLKIFSNCLLHNIYIFYMNKMTKEELEARLAKHAEEMDNGKSLSTKEIFKKLDKQLRLSK